MSELTLGELVSMSTVVVDMRPSGVWTRLGLQESLEAYIARVGYAADLQVIRDLWRAEGLRLLAVADDIQDGLLKTQMLVIPEQGIIDWNDTLCRIAPGVAVPVEDEFYLDDEDEP